MYGAVYEHMHARLHLWNDNVKHMWVILQYFYPSSHTNKNKNLNFSHPNRILISPFAFVSTDDAEWCYCTHEMVH